MLTPYNLEKDSTMTLGEKQRVFTLLIAKLVAFAYSEGFELTFGDAYRDPRVHGAVGVKKTYSSANSVHKDRLAVDFNLFKNGKFLTSSEDHKALGTYWKTLHEDCRWGGDFSKPDGNHYSMAWQGRQ